MSLMGAPMGIVAVSNLDLIGQLTLGATRQIGD